MTQPSPADPAAALDRVRRAATQWRLAHDEGDLPVAWDEAAITVLALIDNPNVTWTDLGFTRPAITGHAVVQPAPDSRHTVDNLINRAEHHGGLTGDEAARLREGVGQLYGWLTTARAAARAERTRAAKAEAEVARYEAAVAEIRAELIHWDGVVIHRIRAALDAHTNPEDET